MAGKTALLPGCAAHRNKNGFVLMDAWTKDGFFVLRREVQCNGT
ncbi:hypothetical protein [Petralouisia muris]|jgi:hypothetical protein|nr:hypothetical protein [Petralouisia muris]